MTQDQQSKSAEAVAAIAEFALDLKVVRRQAGDLSYRRLGSRTSYSVATITRALKGETLPGWPFTEEFLRACGCRPEEIGRWRARWVKIMQLIDPLPRARVEPDSSVSPEGQVLGQLPGTECETCGAWVTNVTRHAEWHTAFIPKLVVVADGEHRKRATYRRTG